MKATFRKRHRLLLQAGALLAMLLLPVFLYFSAEARAGWLVRGLLGGLAWVMLFASWVSADREKPQSPQELNNRR